MKPRTNAASTSITLPRDGTVVTGAAEEFVCFAPTYNLAKAAIRPATTGSRVGPI
jgi:hypothetical protein